MIKKSKTVAISISFAFLFLSSIVFSYAFGTTSPQVKLTSSLLDLSSNVQQKSDYCSVSFIDDNNSLSFSEAINVAHSFYGYGFNNVFYNYVSLGNDNRELNENGGQTVHVRCDEFDTDVDVMKIHGYNDIDYIYELPLPLYRFYTDSSGKVSPYPSFDERPMNHKWPNSDFPSYISSEFADSILKKYPELYSCYSDIIDKGFLYTINVKTKDSEREVILSVNNIFLSSNTDNWNLETKEKFLSKFDNYPLFFGELHKYGIFVNDSSLFEEFGFYYEADIENQYGNYDYFFNLLSKACIKKHSLNTVFCLNDNWVDYHNISSILLEGDSSNYFLLICSILMCVISMPAYCFLIIVLSHNRYRFLKSRVVIYMFPITFLFLLHLSFFIFLHYNVFLFHLINNSVSNVIVLIYLICLGIGAFITTRYIERKRYEN